MTIRVLILFALILLCRAARSQSEKVVGKIKVDVHWAQAKENDTLYLMINNPAYDSHNLKELKSGLKNGKFSFESNVTDSTGYFAIVKRRTFTDDGGRSRFDMLTVRQTWIVGDSIDFKFSYYKEAGIGSTDAIYKVEGLGGVKYNLAKEIDSILRSSPGEPGNCDDLESLFRDPFKKVKDMAFSYLNKFSHQLKPIEYFSLKAGIDYFNGRLLFMTISNCYTQTETAKQPRFIEYYEKHINDLVPRPQNDVDLLNTRYIEFLFQRYANESKIRNNNELNFTWLYNKIMCNEEGDVRDRVIAKLFGSVRKPNSFPTILKDAMTIVLEKYSRKWIETFQEQTEGRMLKDFPLLDTAENLINISSFKGKVIVLDFWATGCGACSLLYKNVICKLKPQFVDNVIFISVGTDGKKDRWMKGIASGMFTSKDDINLYTGPQSMKHPFIFNNLVTATPTVILLNQEGKIIKFNTEDLYTEKGMTEALNSLLAR